MQFYIVFSDNDEFVSSVSEVYDSVRFISEWARSTTVYVFLEKNTA